MKKLFYFSAAALTSLFAASCASDDVPEINADGMTSFQVQLPEGLDTRDFGDGNSATQLYVAIYDAAGEANAAPLFSNFTAGAENGMEVTNFTGRQATVTVNLVKNKTYNIVLWAQQPEMTATGGAFTYSTTARTIQVDYDKLACNTENSDAFYSYETYTSTPTASKTFTLYRPFAQINIGTDDLQQAANAGMTVEQAGLTVTGCADKLDLATGTASGNATVTYTPTAIPTSTDGAFPVDNYSYLTMGYVLVPGDKTAKGTVNVSLNVNGQPQNPFASYPNVPVQANYRTNIYGSLLTNPEVFNVTIEPAFNTPANDVGPWDGTSVKKPAINETGKSIEIYTPDELAWLAGQLNNENNQYAAYAINLNRDIDLNGKAWTPVGNLTAYTGQFNGNNHTIKNLTGNSGLFLNVGEGANIHDLNFENVNIKNENEKHVAGGGALANDTKGATVSNINVLSGTIYGTSDVGGVIGRAEKTTITNCTNSATISGQTQLGGIAGRSFSGTVTGCKNYGNVSTIASSEKAEGIGGVLGQQLYGGSVTGCTNEGDIVVRTSEGNIYGAGGIIGWIRYSTGSDWLNPNTGINGIVEVSGCNNSGTVTTAGTGAGGIVGIVFIAANVHNNTNTASSLHAGSDFAAGIVGGYQVYGTQESYYPYLPENFQPVCYVTDNVSTTPIDNITGPNHAQYVYNNAGDKLQMSGNTDVLP